MTMTRPLLRRLSARAYAMAAAAPPPKAEGSIADVFASMSGAGGFVWPDRFGALKRELWHDGLRESWAGVLQELSGAVEELKEQGPKAIPQVEFKDMKDGFSAAQADAVKKAGCVIVKGGVSQEEASEWTSSLRGYIAQNRALVRGYPAGAPQFFELYNARAQLRARTHPALVATQAALLGLWHAPADAPVSLRTPLAYFDRLRFRAPGRMPAPIGPHVDTGGIERWEDPALRESWRRILAGYDAWRRHDPFDARPWIEAKQDLYGGPNQCTVFRPWQGWTALSHTRAGEGTLRVLPLLRLATAYVALRPFFRLRRGAPPTSTDPRDWEPSTDNAFEGCAVPGKTMEPSEKHHPHLRLADAMVSIPAVEPGDQVYWHCDLIHAVEDEHKGQHDSAVLYIPAVPLTAHNARYLRRQRGAFREGLSAPDFPGGDGERAFVGRGQDTDVPDGVGRQMLGLQPFDLPEDATPGERAVIRAANGILF